MTVQVRYCETAHWLTVPEYFRTVVEAERRAEAVAKRLPAELEVFVLEDPPSRGFVVCFAGWVSDLHWREGLIVETVAGSRDLEPRGV